MKKIFLFCLVVLPLLMSAQLKGVVTDENGAPVARCNIYVKDSYISTTTNDKGNFEINFKKNGKYVVLFQYIGYKTHREEIDYTGNLKTTTVLLVKEEYQLDQVVIKKGENPAIAIMKKAIANRKKNGKASDTYTADFYSRGIFRVKDLPKKFMGQKMDMFDEIIDSTRSGILYLSETVSQITAQKPDKLKENIIASKVSGRDNGFSFNTARTADFDFYNNYIDLGANMISPIADNAFNYYKYKFEGSFFDENNLEVSKIKVTPKRVTEPIFTGYIYIVDDSFAIHSLELTATGKQMQNEGLNTLTLKQNFIYNSKTKIWTKNVQTIDFDAGIFTFKFNGKFTHVFSNYQFPEKLDKKTFTAQILKIEPNANKKDDTFWTTNRPVPLTLEESSDYIKKDVLQTKKKSKVYLDSIDKKRNKFGFGDILGGYTYNNSFKKYTIGYDNPIKSITFNTVQGWKAQTDLYYSKYNDETRKYFKIGSHFDYGFAEKKFRASAFVYQKIETQHHSYYNINAGSKVNQFNNAAISDIINTVSTLFFKNNFMQLYQSHFASAQYGRELVNGLYTDFSAEYFERKPLFNNTNYSPIKSDDVYSSNNPLLPFDENIPAFEKYNLVKTKVNARINFKQKYLSRPDGKYNIPNEKIPTLNITYEKGFAGNESRYNFDFLNLNIKHDLMLGNKGYLEINTNLGTFFGAKNIAFADYKHFNGNQTHIGTAESYTNVFNIMPYYANSTNKSFFELHAEHNDNGYIMNKIPLLNKLQSHLVLGFHNLAVADRKPYQEFTVGLDHLGFGKFKMFRIDYVRSFQNGTKVDGVVFGLKFLNIIGTKN